MKILTGILVLPLIVTISILAMIHGWGLEPQNWWWIIGSTVAIFIVGMLKAAADD